MAQIYETDEVIERVLLIGVALDDNDEAESSLDELAELAKTAGAVTVGRLIQPREYFHPATYIGKGKLEEVRLMADELDATGIICDDELTPVPSGSLPSIYFAYIAVSYPCSSRLFFNATVSFPIASP